MSEFNTKADLRTATLQAGQRAKTNGLDTLLDGGHQDFFIQTLADYGGVAPDESLTEDVLLANGTVAVALGSNALPLTGIIMWPEAVAPAGWTMLDGSVEAFGIDMRNRVPRMPLDPNDVLGIGGSNDSTFPTVTSSTTLTLAQVPPMSVTLNMDAAGQGDAHNSADKVARGRDTATTAEAGPVNVSAGGGGGHTHAISGSGGIGANIPAFTYVNFIMRTSELTQVVTANPPEGVASYINVNGTVQLDAQFGAISIFVVKPDADITNLVIINAPSAADSGYAASIKMISDGSSAITWNAQFNWTADTPPTLTTVADGWDWIVAVTDDLGVTFDATLSIGALD